jgi:hypothetical protein
VCHDNNNNNNNNITCNCNQTVISMLHYDSLQSQDTNMINRTNPTVSSCARRNRANLKVCSHAWRSLRKTNFLGFS